MSGVRLGSGLSFDGTRRCYSQAMRPHPRVRKTIKWSGAAVTLLLAVAWIGSAWAYLNWGGRSGYFGISGGVACFLSWGPADPPHAGHAPDKAYRFDQSGGFTSGRLAYTPGCTPGRSSSGESGGAREMSAWMFRFACRSFSVLLFRLGRGFWTFKPAAAPGPATARSATTTVLGLPPMRSVRSAGASHHEAPPQNPQDRKVGRTCGDRIADHSLDR
jgi:hypothetical protein